MILVNKEIAESICKRLISETNDQRFFIEKELNYQGDYTYKISHTFLYESEIEQSIYNNLICNPFIGGE